MFSFMFLRVEAGSSDQDLNGLISPHDILHSLRLKSRDRIILGHININSIRHKIGLLGDMIKDKIDILLISETKIDQSFPKEQFRLNGYSDPYRLDRNTEGVAFFFIFEMISPQSV